MYTRILVPVDGSATSLLGVNEALKVATDGRAQLTFLNVVDEAILIPTAEAFPATAADQLLASLRACGKQALDQAAGLAAKRKIKAQCTQLDSGARFVSEIILDYARKVRADLIVMGTHGRRGVSRLLMGSDAERVLRQTSVPLLLVRGDRLKPALRKVLQISTVPTHAARAPRARRKQPA